MSNSEWEYVRTNSKGEAIFRRDTDDDFDFVCSYFEDKDIPYKFKEGGNVFIIKNKTGKDYVYYWSTGRWSPKHKSNKIHYHSKGVEDFVTKYLNKYNKEELERIKEREEQRKLYFIEKEKRRNANASDT